MNTSCKVRIIQRKLALIFKKNVSQIVCCVITVFIHAAHSNRFPMRIAFIEFYASRSD